MLKYLIGAGADIDKGQRDGAFPLSHAIAKGHIEAVRCGLKSVFQAHDMLLKLSFASGGSLRVCVIVVAHCI